MSAEHWGPSKKHLDYEAEPTSLAHGIDPRVMPLTPGAKGSARLAVGQIESRVRRQRDRRTRIMISVERASGFTTH